MYALNGGVDVIYASRGCLHNCVFCNAPGFWGGKWTGRNVESVMNEMRLLKATGISKLHIYDLNISTDERWFANLLKALMTNDLDFRWDCMIRTEALYDEAFVDRMIAAGCREVFIGVESLAIDRMPDSSKKVDPVKFKVALEMARDKGLLVAPGIIIGLPFETEEMIRANIEHALSLAAENLFYFPRFELFVPWRGTEYGDHPARHGIRMLTDRYDYMHFYPPEPIAETEHVSGQRIFELFLEAVTRSVEVIEAKTSDLHKAGGGGIPL